MLTGQEKIEDLMAKSAEMEQVLQEFGINIEIVGHLKLKNLAHAAVVLKQPLGQILKAISKVTGEEIRKPRVRGMENKHGGLRKGVPAGIKRVIAVHSGKGGVGKTFVAVNLAVHLASQGHKVALLDADIDCPNVMKYMGLEGKLIANKDKKIVPMEKFGVKVISTAPLQPKEDDPILWRGPVTSKAIEQLIQETAWGKLDFLIVDLPPGTSDAPISVLDILNSAEMLIVTTPQELAILDARKSINMARYFDVPIMGIIENMAGDIFGRGNAKKLADDYDVPFFGSIELNAKYANSILKDDKPLQKVFDVVLC